jgi:hypothetical protein
VIVADVNVVAYLLIDGRFTTAARNSLKRDDHWIAPPQWRAEFVNVLATNVGQRMFSVDQAIEKLNAADLLVQTTNIPLFKDVAVNLEEFGSGN